MSRSIAPTLPCTIIGTLPDGSRWHLAFSRWSGAVSLPIGDRLMGHEVQTTEALAGVGARARWEGTTGWTFGSEPDARRALEWILRTWDDVSEVQLVLAGSGLPGSCEFWLRPRRADGLVEVTPALEYQRDEQRARVPEAEAWLEAVLADPAFGARAEWTAQWVVRPEAAIALIRGPLDPFPA